MIRGCRELEAKIGLNEDENRFIIEMIETFLDPSLSHTKSQRIASHECEFLSRFAIVPSQWNHAHLEKTPCHRSFLPSNWPSDCAKYLLDIEGMIEFAGKEREREGERENSTLEPPSILAGRAIKKLLSRLPNPFAPSLFCSSV